MARFKETRISRIKKVVRVEQQNPFLGVFRLFWTFFGQF